jgi:tetratricopeptide (TPR) repeat protein
MLILLLGALDQPVMAQEKADLLWNFAGEFYQQQDFYRALGEYQRFIFLFPSDPRASEAELQIGRCYRQGGKHEKAFDHFISLFNRRKAEPVGREALMEAVEIRAEQKRYQEAIYWTKRLVADYPEDPEIDTIYLRLAWLQIDSGQYEHALDTLDRIPPESKLYAKAKSLGQALQQRPAITEKSPKLAGGLSAVLPGAGHLYAGRPGKAVTSFLLNALFIAGAVAAFEHNSPVLGGILIFFELGWYVGGIRSAAQTAREYNEKQEIQYRQELKHRYRLSLGMEPGVDRLAFSLRLDF